MIWVAVGIVSYALFIVLVAMFFMGATGGDRRARKVSSSAALSLRHQGGGVGQAPPLQSVGEAPYDWAQEEEA